MRLNVRVFFSLLWTILFLLLTDHWHINHFLISSTFCYIEQKKFGVPENHLSGHAFHTYSLGSSEGDVSFQFQHNVCGRRTYAEGTVDAIFFLFTQLMDEKKNSNSKKIFNMIDVLKSGGMRWIERQGGQGRWDERERESRGESAERL